MCGIAGVLVSDLSHINPDLTSLVRRMVGAIRHRGPDDSGVFVGNGVALGHARLSIIDLSAAGHQPMATADGQVRIVFNGEIYNFKELRAQLFEKGYHFNSHTDTEVILNGYHHWGKDVFTHLRGMFAIALWDARSEELILARDRVGKKPLFYAWHEGVLLFGSEIKAILACPGFARKPDLEAIHHYLSLQYVPTPWSAFQGVKKVPQASYMIFTRRGDVRVEKYWQLPHPHEARHRPVEELREELVSLLDEYPLKLTPIAHTSPLSFIIFKY